jgi:uncharacterized lipoprotein YajG
MKKPLVLSVLATTILLTGCATTIIDTAPTTTAVAPTTTVPSGTNEQLLEQMRLTIGDISTAMSASDKTKAKARLTDLQLAWKVLQPQIADKGEQLTQDLQRLIDLADSAVTRNRPADADKALRFLQIVIESLT